METRVVTNNATGKAHAPGQRRLGLRCSSWPGVVFVIALGTARPRRPARLDDRFRRATLDGSEARALA